MKNIRNYMKTWEKYTYMEGLRPCRELKENKELYHLTTHILHKLNLSNKPMTGSSVANLPATEKQNVPVCFADIFSEIERKNFVTPAYYLAKVIEKCKENNISDDEKIAQIACRGLRAFATYIREMDLQFQLENIFKDATFKSGSHSAPKDHTGILMKYHGESYRIWAYQGSFRGRTHTSERFMEKRGALHSGMYLLCPIHINDSKCTEDISEWRVYSKTYLEHLKELVDMKNPDRYTDIARKGENAVNYYLKEMQLVCKQ